MPVSKSASHSRSWTPCSAGGNELDLVAAVHALSAFGDTELAVIKDQKSTVRIWMDSKNSD